MALNDSIGFNIGTVFYTRKSYQSIKGTRYTAVRNIVTEKSYIYLLFLPQGKKGSGWEVEVGDWGSDYWMWRCTFIFELLILLTCIEGYVIYSVRFGLLGFRFYITDNISKKFSYTKITHCKLSESLILSCRNWFKIFVLSTYVLFSKHYFLGLA